MNVPGTRQGDYVTAQGVVQASDGLPALEVGAWTTEKLTFLRKLMGIFNQGMKNLWPNRVYIDLFAGPGVNVIENTTDEIDGSSLLSLRTQVPFSHYFFNDLNPAFINALRQRADKVINERGLSVAVNVQYLIGDCNDAVPTIVDSIPQNALILVFIDPWRWEIHFESIEMMTAGQRADLLITMHTGSIKRSAHHVLQQVDRFLADIEWRRDFLKAPRGRRTRVILDRFEKKLEALGYRHENIDDRVLVRNTKGAPLYHLVFASKHPRGMDFWNKISDILPSGQRRLF